MRTRYFVITLLAMALVVSCATPGQKQATETEADVQAIRNVLDEWIKAVNTGDAERLLSTVSDDVEMFPPGQPPIRGGQAHEFLRGFLEQVTVELKPFTNEEIVVGGDWAFQRHSYQLSVTPKDGSDSITEKGHGIHIFRRESDGSWKM